MPAKQPTHGVVVAMAEISYPYMVILGGIEVRCASVEAALRLVTEAPEPVLVVRRASELALRLLRELSRQQGPVPASELAKRLDLQTARAIGPLLRGLKTSLADMSINPDAVLRSVRSDGNARAWVAGPRLAEALEVLDAKTSGDA